MAAKFRKRAPVNDATPTAKERSCRNSILNSFEFMRNVLEEAMTRVPLEISNTTTKAYLAECILKTAAQGHTAYNELLSAATDQIQVIVSIFT